jgi:hypothetical protein
MQLPSCRFVAAFGSSFKSGGAICNGKESKAQTPSLHCAAATSYDQVFNCPGFRFGELKPFTPPVACSVAFLMTAWAEVWIWFRSALPSEALTHLTRQLWWRLSTSSGTSARRCSCDSAVSELVMMCCSYQHAPHACVPKLGMFPKLLLSKMGARRRFLHAFTTKL